jgi:hypothetical protein
MNVNIQRVIPINNRIELDVLPYINRQWIPGDVSTVTMTIWRMSCVKKPIVYDCTLPSVSVRNSCHIVDSLDSSFVTVRLEQVFVCIAVTREIGLQLTDRNVVWFFMCIVHVRHTASVTMQLFQQFSLCSLRAPTALSVRAGVSSYFGMGVLSMPRLLIVFDL